MSAIIKPILKHIILVVYHIQSSLNSSLATYHNFTMLREKTMPVDLYISQISVEGLHDQFDVELNFTSGLNIIYGKNGRGKTTLLHLLANALELDFKRFAFLQFHRISILNNRGQKVSIVKETHNTPPNVLIDDSATSFKEGKELSDAEIASLREIMGERPTYLPAFRSILERTRLDPTNFRADEHRESEFQEILNRERDTAKDLLVPGSRMQFYENRILREQAHSTAQKTILCRQWFGRFVPVIRYPSVADVDDALSEEWRIAQIEFTRREQRMFEETFVKVFNTIAEREKSTSIENNDILLTSISELLLNQESQLATTESRAIYDSLLNAVRSIHSTSELGGIDNSLLYIYRQVLEKRNTERRSTFQRSRDFEASINKFLDNKTLKIGQQAVPNARAHSAVAVRTESGHSYGLSGLSSGERQILTMLYSASRTRFPSGVFLIDEPELSLHIDWQRIILQELQNQSGDRQIITCTHSPEVAADHMHQIHIFEPSVTEKPQETQFTDEEF